MNRRFQNEEIRYVSKQFAENELYKAISSIGPQLEAELAEFGLCPEECFKETLELLTLIAEKGDDVLPELDNLWLRKFNEYRRFDRQVNENEIRKAVGIVFGFTILSTASSRHPFYRRTLPERLMTMVANHKFDGWSKSLEQIFSVPLPDGWFDAFIEEEPERGNDMTAKSLPLPQAINTKRAQKYFQIAIENKYMKVEEGKFYWIGVGGRGTKSQLAYFCGLVYEYRNSINGNIGTVFPENELVALFGVHRLFSLLTQVYNAQKKQSWRRKIDEMFE